ncbi:hypothetical protein CYMTET_7623 [Cymbomonas tetramitiformis]|uniref:Uncharacterized protein n=1 Tax=Cymbomonas tetramitiformis TaxID=36881 RepID=A0AAE0GVB3_9CHLO|nr:hypothetical protein CYMTET_7623 [Cymbomonas tetramitiformis]
MTGRQLLCFVWFQVASVVCIAAEYSASYGRTICFDKVCSYESSVIPGERVEITHKVAKDYLERHASQRLNGTVSVLSGGKQAPAVSCRDASTPREELLLCLYEFSSAQTPGLYVYSVNFVNFKTELFTTFVVKAENSSTIEAAPSELFLTSTSLLRARDSAFKQLCGDDQRCMRKKVLRAVNGQRSPVVLLEAAAPKVLNLFNAAPEDLHLQFPATCALDAAQLDETRLRDQWRSGSSLRVAAYSGARVSLQCPHPDSYEVKLEPNEPSDPELNATVVFTVHVQSALLTASDTHTSGASAERAVSASRRRLLQRVYDCSECLPESQSPTGPYDIDYSDDGDVVPAPPAVPCEGTEWTSGMKWDKGTKIEGLTPDNVPAVEGCTWVVGDEGIHDEKHIHVDEACVNADDLTDYSTYCSLICSAVKEQPINGAACAGCIVELQISPWPIGYGHPLLSSP